MARALVIAFLLLGFGLRVYLLDRQGIWGDEAASIARSYQALPDVLVTTLETHPPLYSLLLYLWAPFTGTGPFALRYPSVLAGALGIALIVALGRRVIDRPTAVVAAGLLAISPMAIYYSQEARMYIFALDLGLAATIVFGRISAECRVQSAKKYRVPSTEYRVPSTECRVGSTVGATGWSPTPDQAPSSSAASSPGRLPGPMHRTADSERSGALGSGWSRMFGVYLVFLVLSLAGYLTHYFTVFVTIALNVSWFLLVAQQALSRVPAIHGGWSLSRVKERTTGGDRSPSNVDPAVPAGSRSGDPSRSGVAPTQPSTFNLQPSTAGGPAAGGAEAPGYNPDDYPTIQPSAFSLQPWVASQVFFALLAAGWMWTQLEFLTGRAREADDPPGLEAALASVPETLSAFTVGVDPAPGAEGLPLRIALGLAAFGALALVVRAVSGFRERIERIEGAPAGLAATIIIPQLVVTIGLGVVAVYLLPFFHPRYLLVGLPAFLLLVAAGLTAIPSLLGWLALRASRFTPHGSRLTVHASRTLGWVAALAIIYPVAQAGADGLRSYFTEPASLKSGYGRLIAQVRQQARPGDGLLLNNPLQESLYTYYQIQDLPVYWFPPLRPWNDPATEAELSAIAEKHRRLWLVMFGDPAEYDAGRDLERWLSRRGFRSYREGFIDGELSLYVVDSGSASQEITVNARLGESIRLRGYRLSAERARPGDDLLLTVLWETSAPLDRPYSVFAHLLGDTNNPALGNRIWAQFDGEPAGGSAPTTRWRPGQVIEDRRALHIANDAPPGRYELEVGLYQLTTGERLPVRLATGEAADRVVLAYVLVE